MENKKQILAQGSIPVTATSVYTPTINQLATITNIRITPTDTSTGYNVTCYKISPGNSIKQLFKLENLGGGDWIDDDTEYPLGMGDAIQLVSDVEFLDYVIHGFEYGADSYNFGNNPFTK